MRANPPVGWGRILATLGGVGRAKIASGTFGSIVALPFVAGIHHVFDGARAPWVGLAVVALLTPLAVHAAGETAREEGKEDPGVVVIDEFLGQMVAGLFAGATAAGLGLSFLAFRFFDILKPPPLREAERLPGGWGIVADDLLAGILAAIAVEGVQRIF